MTAGHMMDPAHFVHEQLARASPDLLRELKSTFVNTRPERGGCWCR